MSEPLLRRIDRQAAECLGSLDLLIAVVGPHGDDPNLAAYASQLRRLRRDFDLATASRVTYRLEPQSRAG